MKGKGELLSRSSKIDIYWPWEMPNSLDGIVVVADICAATTNIVSFLERGVERLFLVNEQSVACLKNDYPEALIIGESQALPEGFFDTSNMPYKSAATDVSGKVVLYMTDNGTRIIEEAFRRGAEQVITVSFTNITKIKGWLQEQVDKPIHLIPAGHIATSEPRHEDRICLEALQQSLAGDKVDWEQMMQKAEKAIGLTYESAEYARDLGLMLEKDKYFIVPKCKRRSEGLIVVEK